MVPLNTLRSKVPTNIIEIVQDEVKVNMLGVDYFILFPFQTHKYSPYCNFATPSYIISDIFNTRLGCNDSHRHLLFSLNVHPPLEGVPALVPEVHLDGVELHEDVAELETEISVLGLVNPKLRGIAATLLILLEKGFQI